MSQADLKGRVEAAAAPALARKKFTTPVDVCAGIGWLHESNVEDWRCGMDDLLFTDDRARLVMEIARLLPGFGGLKALPPDGTTRY